MGELLMRTKFTYRWVLTLIAALAIGTQSFAGYFGELDVPANFGMFGPTSGGNATATYRLMIGADLPFPSATTLGGVKSLSCAAGDFISQLSTGGVLTCGTPAGSGTVTSVSVVTANGLAGTVATATSTPAITLTTSVSGIVKGNGTALSAATSGTDYSAGTSGNTTGIVKSTTGTGALTTAIAADFPTLNQNTTGNAATVTTNANLTGPVTSVGNATSVTTNAITNTMAAQMAAHTYKGNNTGSTANAADLTSTQVTADLNTFTSGLQGLVPASGGGTTNFLRADGTFAAPAGGGGGGGGSSMEVSQYFEGPLTPGDTSVPFSSPENSSQLSSVRITSADSGFLGSSTSFTITHYLNNIPDITYTASHSGNNGMNNTQINVNPTISATRGDTWLVTSTSISNGTPRDFGFKFNFQ